MSVPSHLWQTCAGTVLLQGAPDRATTREHLALVSHTLATAGVQETAPEVLEAVAAALSDYLRRWVCVREGNESCMGTRSGAGCNKGLASTACRGPAGLLCASEMQRRAVFEVLSAEANACTECWRADW